MEEFESVTTCKKMIEQVVLPSAINILSSWVTTHGGIRPFLGGGEVATMKNSEREGGDDENFE